MIRSSISDISEQESQLAPPTSPADINQQAGTLDSSEPAESPNAMLEVLAAPFRGAESAVRNAYGLADYLTADMLPNWDKNFLGNSQTTAGSMVEGVSQFLTGFIPGIGVAGKLGQAVGLAGKAGKIAKAATAGAMADFTVFDGHEERLSNLLQTHAGLRDPITSYLASNEEDSELHGRFKNALEGLGAGAVADAILPALRVVKTGRAAKAGTSTAEEATAAAAEAGAKIPGAMEPLARREVVLGADIDDELGNVIAKFDPDSVEGSGLFQFPKKGIAHRVEAHEDVVKMIEATTSALRKTAPQTKGALDEASVDIMARMTGQPHEDLVANLRAREAVMQDAALHDYALGKVMLATATEVSHNAKLVASGVNLEGLTREQSILSVLKSQEVFSDLVAISKGFGTIEGRALNARKFIKTAQIEATNVARELVEQFGGEKFISEQFTKLSIMDADGVAKMMNKQLSFGDRMLRVHNEYWINAVLSGPKTSVVNTLGNTFTTLYQPLEQAIGAAFSLNMPAVRASLKNYSYLTQHVGDSWGFFVKALKNDEAVLLGKTSGVDDLRSGGKSGDPTRGPQIKMDGDNMLASFVNFAGTAIRMPTRFMMAGDEFFKQINYRAAAKSELHYRGLTKGLEGEALAKYVSDGFDKTVTSGGHRFSEDAVIKEAFTLAKEKGLTGKERSQFMREYKKANWNPENSALKEAFEVSNLSQGVAEEATFTRPLGKFGKSVQDFAAAHPITQLFLPFVRTPTNIVKYFGQRGLGTLTFIPGLGQIQQRNIAELASKDALVRSRALGRIATGQMMVSMAGVAALSGKVTGRGPTDEHERKLLMATGWQPYSIKFESAEGPFYLSYQRLDPFATFMGLVADWGDQAKRLDAHASEQLSTTLTALAVAVSNNVTNKTYLASLAQFIDAVNQPERRFTTWTKARIGSYVPSLVAQTAGQADDDQTMREIRGWFDGATNRLPGGQAMLEPKRNVLGETVDSVLAQTPMSAANPVTLSKVKGDRVFEELAQLNHGLQAPGHVFGKVNLLDHKTEKGQTAFDRWQQLTGEVSAGGMTLRERLTELIDQPSYQNLPLTSPGDGMDSPRLGTVRSLLSTYRRIAMAQLQQEIPAIAAEVRNNQMAQADLRRGDKASALERLVSK